MQFRLPGRLVRWLFGLLYGPLAPFYDLISRTFFLGQWTLWQQSVLPFSSGRILEVGAGTGALLAVAHNRGMSWTAVEPSLAMIRQIRKRPALRGTRPVLVRSVAEGLPFRSGAFDTVVLTFPTDYIFDAPTLEELGRVIDPDGSLLIVPGAVLLPANIFERVFDQILKVTEGELQELLTLPGPRGFVWEQKWLASPKGRAMLLIGRRAG